MKREEYQGKMEAQLSDWGAEIDKLAARADKATADAKQGYHEQIETLRTKKESIHAKLQELKTSSDDAWEDLREGLDQLGDQAQDAFKKAAARFK
ncbi:MAG: coiled coil domain-containing protein [Ignavibacteriales bacterium]